MTGSAPNGPGLFGGDESSWGNRYGGVDELERCELLPAPARPGCRWRYEQEGLAGADNPGVSYKRVKCGYHPKLYERSGCLLAADVV